MGMTNDEIAEMIAERNGNQHYCKNCDDCCQPYNSTDDCFKSAMQAMELKEQQIIEKAWNWLTEQKGERTIDDFKEAMEKESDTHTKPSKLCYDYHGNPIINNFL